jgi:hypothetical protein
LQPNENNKRVNALNEMGACNFLLLQFIVIMIMNKYNLTDLNKYLIAGLIPKVDNIVQFSGGYSGLC